MTAVTIPKNAVRKITELRSRLTRCKVYTERNHFLGSDTDPEHAWTALGRPRARLTDNGDGTWTVTVHGGLWYELTEGQPHPSTIPTPGAVVAATPRLAAYRAAARDAGPDGRPVVCEFEHRRGVPAAAFLVGPVLMAREVLACGDHLTTAVRLLSGYIPRAAVTRTIPVKELRDA